MVYKITFVTAFAAAWELSNYLGATIRSRFRGSEKLGKVQNFALVMISWKILCDIFEVAFRIGVIIVNRVRFSNNNVLCHSSCYLEDGNNSENNSENNISSLGTNSLLQNSMG